MNVEYPFFSIIAMSTLTRVVVSVRVLSKNKIDMFANYLYLMGPYVQKNLFRKNNKTNVKMNVRRMQFSNFKV